MKITNYLSIKGSFLTLFTTHVLVIMTHTHTHSHKACFSFPRLLPPGTNYKVGGNHCHVPFVTTFDAHDNCAAQWPCPSLPSFFKRLQQVLPVYFDGPAQLVSHDQKFWWARGLKWPIHKVKKVIYQLSMFSSVISICRSL